MSAIEILKMIEKAKANGYRSFGLRTTVESHQIGDELEASHSCDMWGDDLGELDGTCATGFGYLWFDGEAEDIEAIERALEINSRYAGDYRYLIASAEYCQDGEDEYEVIIPSAEVVGELN